MWRGVEVTQYPWRGVEVTDSCGGVLGHSIPVEGCGSHSYLWCGVQVTQYVWR